MARGGVLTFLLMLALMVAGTQRAAAKSKPRVQRVYIFGFSASFTDSLACITPVQQLDSAWVDPSHGMLMDRALYSLQLQYHVESAYGVSNNTCAVFFAKSQRKAERQWNKLRRRYSKDQNVKFRELNASDFSFKAENYEENAPVEVNE